MSAAPHARVQLRPRGVTESADLGLRFVALNARSFGALALWTIVPGFVVGLLLRYALGADTVTTWLVSWALSRWIEGTFTVLCGQLALRDRVRAGEVLSLFRPRAMMYAGALVMAGMMQALGFVLMFAGWVFAAMATVYLPEVVLLEGATQGMFKRSNGVTLGHTGRAFGAVAILMVGRIGAALLADVSLSNTLGVLLDVRIPVETLADDGFSPYALAGLWLSVPFAAAIRYFSYIDLRTLREGWDLQRRFAVLSSQLSREGQA